MLNTQNKKSNEYQLEVLANKIEEPPTKSYFWPGKFYGQGKWVKKYAFYPQWLPLPVFTEHSGPSKWDEVRIEKNIFEAPYVLKSSPREVFQLRTKYNLHASILMSPFVFYRRFNRISWANEAAGTVAFPVHSAPIADLKYDVDDYINELLSLPAQYQPITICLYYNDILNGVHEKYEEYFNVVTCGRRDDSKFIERFYSIVRKHKYATSNGITTSLYYAVEFGLSFFFLGDIPEIHVKKKKKFQDGGKSLNQQNHFQKKIRELFQEKLDSPTQAQIQFIKKELGVIDSISRLKASFILYRSLLIFTLMRIINKLKNIS